MRPSLIEMNKRSSQLALAVWLPVVAVGVDTDNDFSGEDLHKVVSGWS